MVCNKHIVVVLQYLGLCDEFCPFKEPYCGKVQRVY